MILPNGITGFCNSVENQPPKVDRQQFKQLCYDIVIHSRGKIVDFKEPEYPMNFYSVYVHLFNKNFYILLNEHYPFLAFSSSVEFGNIRFIDLPNFSEQFTPFYKVLHTGELSLPLTMRNGSKKDVYKTIII
ncbi:hypothetical protein [Bacillus sp. JJ722]|uniref:hypothetical protein n=1 Tax=Bacillus sp. JJ722 TaxID=3122973 RepID=UPI0030007AB1